MILIPAGSRWPPAPRSRRRSERGKIRACALPLNQSRLFTLMKIVNAKRTGRVVPFRVKESDRSALVAVHRLRIERLLGVTKFQHQRPVRRPAERNATIEA